MTHSTSCAVWLHVSTLMAWDRPPVGIVRVEREYCHWLLERAQRGEGEPVRFCVYDRARGQFSEVPHDQVLARLYRKPSPPVPQQAALPAWKARVKQAWHRVRPHLPQAWVPALTRNARLALHHLLQARARLRATVARWRSPTGDAAATACPPAAFGPGDRFVSLGADWEYLNQEALYRAKQQLGLRVTLISYDSIPVLLPHLFVGVLSPGGFGAYMVDMAWCADAILCISECTRRDFERVMNQLGAPVPPTQVIRLGTDIHRADEPAEAPPGLPHGPDDRPFVLYVSTIERRKNHEILYRAWTRLRDRGMVPYRLVFVGMRGWGVNDLFNDLQLDPRVKDDIVSLNHVSDAQLAWLYRHAAFTVFPSLYEGWGLPVVESLAWGKFCLASSAASLPEAGGPWAEYLDPWDLPGWTDRLAYYMQHPEAVEQHNERIAREYRAPGWAESAADIHQVVIAVQPRKNPA